MVKVVLIDSRRQRSERMQRALSASGFSVMAVLRDNADLQTHIHSPQPDAINFDAESPTRATPENCKS